VKPDDIEALQNAVIVLNNGELGSLIELMSEDMVWRGQPQRWMPWRPTPS
jgi:hypothetical protein